MLKHNRPNDNASNKIWWVKMSNLFRDMGISQKKHFFASFLWQSIFRYVFLSIKTETVIRSCQYMCRDCVPGETHDSIYIFVLMYYCACHTTTWPSKLNWNRVLWYLFLYSVAGSTDGHLLITEQCNLGFMCFLQTSKKCLWSFRIFLLFIMILWVQYIYKKETRDVGIVFQEMPRRSIFH